jgi:hypothetical protein
MLWHHARWVLTYLNRVPGETFRVCQNFMPYYSRLAIILFPEFNGFYRVRTATEVSGAQYQPGHSVAANACHLG